VISELIIEIQIIVNWFDVDVIHQSLIRF